MFFKFLVALDNFHVTLFLLTQFCSILQHQKCIIADVTAMLHFVTMMFGEGGKILILKTA